MKKKKITVRDICLIGVFAAIIAVLSQISIPLPYGVPFTLQTFVVPLAGVILGARRGMISAALYVALGAVGLPVYAGFSGGIGFLVGLTGGFIWAFPFMAFFAGFGVQKGTLRWRIGGLLLAILVVYGAGLIQFMFVTGSSLLVSLVACVLPFLPLEAVKAVLVGTVGVKCRQLLEKNGLVPA